MRNYSTNLNSLQHSANRLSSGILIARDIGIRHSLQCFSKSKYQAPHIEILYRVNFTSTSTISQNTCICLPGILNLQNLGKIITIMIIMMIIICIFVC